MKCTLNCQLTSFPKVRVLKDWFRHFNDHKEFGNDGTLHLFSLMSLYSYANFRSNTQTISGWKFLESPGQRICKLGSLPRILRVRSKKDALELMNWFKSHGFITFDYLSGKQEIIRYEIIDWKNHCTHLNYNYYSYTGRGFFFFPLPIGRKLLAASKASGKLVFSELDAIMDLWLHTVVSDPDVRGSEYMPVVYYPNMHGVPLLSYTYLLFPADRLKVLICHEGGRRAPRDSRADHFVHKSEVLNYQSVLKFSHDELLEVVEHPGETLDRTIKTNRAIDSEVKKMKNLIKDAHVDRHPKWSTYKFAEWQKDRIDNGSDQKSDDFKDEWISAYRDVIKTAADIYDIPPELLAGVAWIEVGGDPMWTDPVAYGARKIIPDIAWNILGLLPNEELQDKLGEINRDASKTSFGCVSMQLGVAANMLGIEPEDLNINTEKRLAEVLSDPKMSIMFAARHLAMLKNIDFPDIPAHELTDDDEVVIANRYNMGGDVPIEAIRQHYYGQRFMDRMDIIEKLLYPDEG